MPNSTDPGFFAPAGGGPGAPLILSLAIDALGPVAAPGPDELDAHLALARQAEAAGFDLILAGYGEPAPGRLDPLTLAASLTTATRTLGLAAVVPSAGWAPYNVARAFAAFDLVAGGRTGWFAAPGAGEAADPGFERFAEHMSVVFDLFDSWDDDALVFDKANAVFADRDKTRRIEHHGRFFTVDGPLNAPRPRQGRPVILQAAGPGEAPSPDADIAVSRAASLEALAADRASTPAPRLVVDLMVSLSGAPLAADRLAWRGSADGLVGLIADWSRSGVVDGFNILPAAPAADLEALAGDVLPALQARGLARAVKPGADLRSRLGLARPANRFSGPREGSRP